MGLSSSDWIALSAVTIALASMGVSFWQGYLSRQHNTLSVKPHLSFEWQLRSDQDVGCTIKNDGLGPAFITSLTIEVAGESHIIDDLFKLLDIFDNEVFHSDEINISYGILNSKSTLSASAIHDLIFFEGTANNSILQSDITIGLREITFILEYTCIYGKRYTQTGTVPI